MPDAQQASKHKYKNCKMLNQQAKLQRHIPGILSSVYIDYLPFLDVNVRELFLKLLPDQTKTVVSDHTEVNVNPKETNRYENIIEKLERKYSSQPSNAADNAVESDFSNSDQENDVENNNIKPDQPRQKKRSKIEDIYDMDDPFIDDSENVADMEAILKMKKVKTKHDGFFVSVGDLDVVDGNIEDDDSSMSVDHGSFRIAKSSPRNSIPLDNTWNKHADVQAAVEQFRETIRKFAPIKIGKTTLISPDIEDALRRLHAVVKTHIGNDIVSIMNKKNGYVHTICELLGSEIGSIGVVSDRIKACLSRMDCQSLAKIHFDKLDEAIETLCTQIKSKISYNTDSFVRTSSVQSVCASHDNAVETDVAQDEAEEDDTVTMSHVPGDTEVIASDSQHVPRPKWKCKWTIPMRVLLVQIEDWIVEWVKLENADIHALNHLPDKRHRFVDSAADPKPLKEKDALTATLQRICEAFPESCLNSDIKSLRKHITTEKGRYRRQLAKEESARVTKDVEAVGPPLAASAISSTPTEGLTSGRDTAEVLHVNPVNKTQPSLPSSSTTTALPRSTSAPVPKKKRLSSGSVSGSVSGSKSSLREDCAVISPGDLTVTATAPTVAAASIVTAATAPGGSGAESASTSAAKPRKPKAPKITAPTSVTQTHNSTIITNSSTKNLSQQPLPATPQVHSPRLSVASRQSLSAGAVITVLSSSAAVTSAAVAAGPVRGTVFAPCPVFNMNDFVEASI